MDGLVVQTLVETQHVKKLFVCSNSLGKRDTVTINEHEISTQDGSYKFPKRVLTACMTTVDIEDVILVSFTSGTTLALKIIAGQGPVPLGLVRSNVMFSRSDSELADQYISCDSAGSILSTCTLEGKLMFSKLEPRALRVGVSPPSSQQTLVVNLRRVVLDSAFLYATGHDMSISYFVVLYATRNGMLCLEMIPIRGGELDFSLDKNTTKLPFKASYVPLYMVPVQYNSGLLVVCSDELLFITMSDIMSGNTEYLRYSSDGRPDKDASFKESSYFYDKRADTIYLGGTNGDNCAVLYTVDIQEKAIVLHSLAKFPELDFGTTFVLEAFDLESGVTDEFLDVCSHFMLTFGGDYVPLTKLIFSRNVDEELLPEYLAFVSDHIDESSVRNNLSPICDGQLIQYGPEKKETLFVCSGIGKNGSLTRVNYGHKAEVFLNGPSLGVISDMYSVLDCRGLQYLVLSYPWGTQIYLITEDSGDHNNYQHSDSDSDYDNEHSYLPSLEPVPEDSGFILDYSTKAIGALSRSLQVLQVVESKIRVTDGEYHFVDYFLPGKIIHAIVLDNILALILHDQSEFSLELFKVKPVNFDNVANGNGSDHEWIEPLHPLGSLFKSSMDITFLKSFRADATGAQYLALGGYDRIISIFKFSSDVTLEPFCRIQADFSIPDDLMHDFEIVSVDKTLEALVSHRGGSYCYIIANPDDGTVLSCRSYNIGRSPVSFIRLQNSNILAADGTRIVCALPAELYRPTAVYFHSNDAYGTGAMRYKRVIPCMCEIAVSTYWNSSGATFLATSINGRLKFITISKTPVPVIRCISVGNTPRRLLYLEYLHAFAVALDSNSSTSRIAFVDPNKERALLTMEERCDFDPLEKIYSLFEWCVVVDGQEYRFLVVGSSSIGGFGKVRVIRLKRMAKGLIVMKLITKWKTEGPVYSIIKTSDNSFAYCEDKSVQIATLKICGQDQIKVDRRYLYKDSVVALQLGCAASSDGFVYLYAMDASAPTLRAFRFKIDQDNNNGDTEDTLIPSESWFLKSEHYSVPLSLCVMNEETVLVSYPDRGLDLVKLVDHQDTGQEKALYSEAKITSLSSIIFKFVQSRTNPKHVLGLSTDGTIYGLSCISKEQLVEIKQNMDRSKDSKDPYEYMFAPFKPQPVGVITEKALRSYTHDSGWNLDILSAITL